MEIVGLAESFLRSLSGWLYAPVTLGLTALVLLLVAMLGGLAREYVDRRRGRCRWVSRFGEEAGRLAPLATRDELELELERLLQRHEIDMAKPIERARFVVRGGPGIGLMGTLIPMGVALAELAQGSMPSMAEQMVHAFNAAVIGLGSGVVAFAIALVREQWLRQDVAAIRYLAEQSLRQRSSAEAK